jgi:lysine-specific demethylase PHF8
MSREGRFSEQRYCICQKSEDELNEQDDNNDCMFECDGCNGWFHGRCVSLPDRIAGMNNDLSILYKILFDIDDIETYFCTECSKQYGPSICKEKKKIILGLNFIFS